MRIAAIDVGSNSLHMVIVEADRRGSFKVLDRERDMVRLGAGALSRGRLPASVMRSGLAVLRRYKRLAGIHRVDKIIAVATSAVRSARNGDDFLEAIGRQTGIWPRVIPGEEEARLVYLAALHSVHLEGKRALVMDLGGGSFELALGAGRKLERVASERLGVLRVSEKFVRTDPVSSKDERRLADQVRRRLGPFAEEIGEDAFDVAVGCSGTILALGAMASEMETGETPDSLHHRKVQASTIRALRKRIVAEDLRGRLRLPGMDGDRADLIVAGAIVLDTALDLLGVKQLTLCEWALREGVLLDYIEKHPRTLARASDYPDIRRRSVVALTERWRHDTPHSRHVAVLALQLFDGTRKLHGLEDGDRALLEYAALLHGVGHHVSHRRHDRHAEYLIRNGDLRGFEPEEIDLLALTARFHKRGRPRRSRAEVARLSRPVRRRLRRLSGLLRLADALDRSHKQLVSALECRVRGRNLRILCSSAGEIELELWGAARRKRLFERSLDVTVAVARAAALGEAAKRAPMLPAGAPSRVLRAVAASK
jgi:exopolyphosphatase/guanosine-5'-triphosphate,3'-diphosphate pyrophosphatase